MTSSTEITGDAEIFACSTHSGMVLDNMSTLLKSQKLCDVILIAKDNKRVTAHRLVLATSSEFFQSMFTGSMRTEIHLKGVEGEYLEKLIQFCYTGCIEIREDNVLSLLSSAILLRFETVVRGCGEFLDRHIHSSNCIGISIFAEQHNLKTLQKNAEKYICKNFMKVCKTEEYAKLSYDELRKLLAHDDIIVDTEETIFNSLMSWIEYDKENREGYFHGFLSDSVKLRQLKPSFIYEYVEPLCKTIESKQLLLDAFKYHLVPEERLQNDRCNGDKTKESLIAIFDYGYETQIQRYCKQTDMWFSAINQNVMPKVYNYGVALVGNKIFIVGGLLDQNNLTNTFYSVDIKTMDLVKLKSMEKKRREMGVAELNGLLYAIGGMNNWSELNTVERWDPKTDTWSCVSPMLEKRNDPRVVVLDGLLYVIGGYSIEYREWMNTIECYDPHTNKWTLKGSMYITPKNFGVAVCGGYIYIVDGVSESVERYNPVTNTFSFVNSRSNRMGDLKCTLLDGCVVAVDRYGNIVEYDPSLNEWKSSKAIPIRGNFMKGLFTVQM